jgi:hypothetical protein
VSIKDEIRFHETHMPGYGGPPQWHVQVSWKNIELEKRRASSERDLGIAIATLQAKWLREWDDQEFALITKDLPLASTPCDGCGGDTIGWGVSVAGGAFCKKCDASGVVERFVEAARATEEARTRERATRDAARIAEKDASIHAQVADAKTGFHWRDGWFFKRTEAGVRITCVKNAAITQNLLIPHNEWASIILAVSAEGEYGRWETGLAFHSGNLEALGRAS